MVHRRAVVVGKQRARGEVGSGTFQEICITIDPSTGKRDDRGWFARKECTLASCVEGIGRKVRQMDEQAAGHQYPTRRRIEPSRGEPSGGLRAVQIFSTERPNTPLGELDLSGVCDHLRLAKAAGARQVASGSGARRWRREEMTHGNTKKRYPRSFETA